tara:strand:- start:61 stop:294 length:234 start_codon:yes stop_codon:yes gene_type:complete
MTHTEYFEALGHHDWYYNYSDDHRAWTKGLTESKRLQSIAQENPTLLRMYKDYSDWVNMSVEARREVHKPEVEDYLN